VTQKWDERLVIKMNSLKLKGKIAEAGYSQRSLSKVLGMSKNTLNSKVNGKKAFNTNEIKKLCGALNISDNEEKADIFLP
jgi:transcriptional regulator with XRE-family HTH domain